MLKPIDVHIVHGVVWSKLWQFWGSCFAEHIAYMHTCTCMYICSCTILSTIVFYVIVGQYKCTMNFGLVHLQVQVCSIRSATKHLFPRHTCIWVNIAHDEAYIHNCTLTSSKRSVHFRLETTTCCYGYIQDTPPFSPVWVYYSVHTFNPILQVQTLFDIEHKQIKPWDEPNSISLCLCLTVLQHRGYGAQ